MSVWKKIAWLVPSVRRAAERDMRDELQSLQDIAGQRELGNLTRAAEDARAAMSWTWLEHTARDVRYGLRSMRRDKTFALLAIASLGLGIGANTALYSVMDAILLRPLPVADPQSLVVMKWRAREYALASTGMSWSTGGSSHDPTTGTLSSIFPYPALKLFQGNDTVLSSAFCYFVEDQLSVTVRNDTDALLSQYVSGNYFEGMGITPAAGRLIHTADDLAGAAAVAVVSHRFGERRFGDAGAAVGQTIRINDQPFVVIGVAPAAFFGAEPGRIPDIYVPMHAAMVLDPSMRASVYRDDHYYWIEIMARLKPGVSVTQAQAVLGPAFLQFADSTASTQEQKQDLPQLTLQAGATGLDSLRRQYAQSIYVLMSMVGLILLIACSNLANLLLARAASRQREIAIRLSIGASRWRVVRQLLTESVLLSSMGGAIGVALAWWGIRVLTVLLSNGSDNFTLHAELNSHVLAVTSGLSILTGLLVGLAPALQATRVAITPALKDVRGRQTKAASRRIGLGHLLIVAQIALSLLLLVAAGVFGRTLSNLHAIALGFNRENVLLFTISPRSVGYNGQALTNLFEHLRQQLSTVSGVEGVSLSTGPMPMGGGTMAPVGLVDAPAYGQPLDPATGSKAALATVGPTFFKTMQIPLASGRDFAAGDHAAAPRVVVVNRRLAGSLGVENPVGHTMTLEGDRFEIIGVADDALIFFLKEERRPVAYFSYLQIARPPGQMTYEIRTAGNPLDLAPIVRQIVRDADSRIAIHDLKTEAAHVDQAISREITLARLCSTFAALALLIACVGLYGTVAFNVARRTNEIGIRMALGARPGGVIWMVLREVLVMTGAGIGIGIPMVVGGSHYLKSFMYQVEPHDPIAIATAVVALLACGVLAGFIPARRASQVDPLGAMRCE